MARFGSLGTQYFDDDGQPLINGFIQFTESGDANTDKDTFADVNQSADFINENPVPLSAAGRQPNIFFTGTARAVLFTSSMVQIEPRDPVGGETVEGSFPPWTSTTIYNIPDIVVGSDDNFYVSITDGNLNNNPVTDEINWTQIKFIRAWNSNETYPILAVVQASDGFLYKAVISNLNNNPVSDNGTNWISAATSEFDNIIINGFINAVPVQTQIASGVATALSSNMTVRGEDGLADTLTTLSGGVDGDIAVLRGWHATLDVTVPDGASISLTNGVSMILGGIKDTLTLLCTGPGAWLELARSSNNLTETTLNLPSTQIEIIGGVATAAGTNMTVRGEVGSADQLDTLNGGVAGDVAILKGWHATLDITIPTSSSLILDGGVTMILGNLVDNLSLECQSPGVWFETGRSKPA